MEMSSANYCPHCGAEAQADTLFCSNCGRPIVGGSESSAAVPYLISPNRIIIMSLVSFGLYLFYWLYKLGNTTATTPARQYTPSGTA